MPGLPTTLEAERGPRGVGVVDQPLRPQAGSAMKFAYQTGDRPLSGYTIQRGVGLGGFGEVYFAQSDAGKQVALKRIQRNLDVELRGVTQCLNLKHPNLLSLYDVRYDEAGQCWVVMEYVAGESLKQTLDRHPQGLPPAEVARWFQGVAAGVAYLHEQGLVHRDLKPGNIFDDAGVVKIGDYGLSKFIAASRLSGQTESVGTFQYMAPEIGRGVYGKEIDLYALGIILYEMLTGHVPFDGESSQEIIMKHLTDDPDLSRVPPRYQALLQRALRKDPAKRFGSAREMWIAWEAASRSAGAAVPGAQGLPNGGRRFGGAPDVWPAEIVNAEAVPGPFARQEAGGPGMPPIRSQTSAAPGADARRELGLPGVPPVSQAQRPTAYPPRPTNYGRIGSRNRAEASGPAQVLAILAIVLGLTFNPWLIPLGAMLGSVYVLYLGIRELVRCATGKAPQPTAPVRTPVSYPVPVGYPVRKPDRAQLWAAAREALRQKQPRERLTEWTGALLLAAAVCAALSLVFLLLNGQSLGHEVASWSLFAWLTTCSFTGTCLLLTLGKAWESQDGDPYRRRFVLLISGLALGLIAFGSGHWLLVNLPDHKLWTSQALSHRAWAHRLYAPDGTPELGAYLIYFAGLLAIPRWWRQVDPLRKHRFSLFATIQCVLWAWGMHVIFRFPQPWGLVLAATVSIAVQLASPWFRPETVGDKVTA